MFTNPMGETRPTTPTAKRRAAYALAFAALCAALVVTISIASAGASRAKVIGHTKHTPGPACPKHCKAIGRVTAFMTVSDGKRNPFRVQRDGKLVAWAVDVGRPDKEQKNSFGGLFGNKKFGNQPTGRIAVIKHKRGVSYKLLRQSPVMKLGGVLGRKEIFTLDKPLSVRKGDIVAFTSPTWTPNFHQRGLSADKNKWRASRAKSNCVPKSGTNKAIHRFARKSHPHQNVGKVRDYECLYQHARLLYWAYFVPQKK